MKDQTSLNVVLQDDPSNSAPRLVTASEGAVIWQAKSTLAARTMLYAMNSIANADSAMQMQKIMMAIEAALLPPLVHRAEPMLDRKFIDQRDVVQSSV